MNEYEPFADHDPSVILKAGRVEGKTYAIMRLKDWPITISESIYKDFYAFVSWSSWYKDKPFYYEKCSGSTIAITADLPNAETLFELYVPSGAIIQLPPPPLTEPITRG